MEKTMKAYLAAHLLLAPFLIFTILAPFGYPLTGAVLGAAIGVISCAKRYGLTMPPIFMAAQVFGVIVVLICLIVQPDLKTTAALALVFAFLAVGALASVLQYKPWTAELSAADVGDFANNPAFIKANIFFSGMWAAIFAWFAFANFQELAPLFRWVPMIVGGLVTVYGPKALMRLAVRRGLLSTRDDT